MDLVTKNFYDGMDIQRADGFVVQTGKPADVSCTPGCSTLLAVSVLVGPLCSRTPLAAAGQQAASSRRPAGHTLAAASCQLCCAKASLQTS